MRGKKPKPESVSQGIPTQRMLQVGEEIRHHLATLLQHYQPFLDQPYEVSVTVTEVRMSSDLRHATAFIMPLATGKETEEIALSLRKNASSLTHRLAGRLPFKFLPTFHFQLDQSFDQAQRIESLLRQK